MYIFNNYYLLYDMCEMVHPFSFLRGGSNIRPLYLLSPYTYLYLPSIPDLAGSSDAPDPCWIFWNRSLA